MGSFRRSRETTLLKHDPAKLRLFLAHRTALIDYATPIVGDRAQAEDVVQGDVYNTISDTEFRQGDFTVVDLTLRASW